VDGDGGIEGGLDRLLHKTIRRVTERIEGFRFNTMVSTLMELVNALVEQQRAGNWHTATYRQALETLLVLLAPSVPHIAEELWQLTGHNGSVHQQSWPVWDEALARDEMASIPVTVDGKVRQVIDVPMDASEDEARKMAVSQPKVQSYLAGREIVRVVYVGGKILNIVTRQV
jgi:leucyl-tRNA synthetase